MSQEIAGTQELMLPDDKTPQEWADYCREGERESVHATIEWCRRVYEAKQSIQITFREWADSYYESYAFGTLQQLAKVGEKKEWLSGITRHREVANDWYTLYLITTVENDVAQIHGSLDQKSIKQFKQIKNHPPANPIPFDGSAGVITGKFQDEGDIVADESVSLIFTDPPYDKETLPQYADLAAFAERVLIPGGSLITYLGDYAMPAVCELIGRSSLSFHWPLVCVHTGQTAHFNFGPYQSLKVKNKLLLWYRKSGKLHRQDEFIDTLIYSEQEKDTHDWQQGTIEASYLIDKLTHPGELIVDPFCGGGTTCVAAKQLGRNYCAFEIDPATAEKARARIHAVG